MNPNSAELQHVPTDGLRLLGAGGACLSGHRQQHRWAALDGNGKFTWTHGPECHLGAALVQPSIAWGRGSKPLQAGVSKFRTANPTFIYSILSIRTLAIAAAKRHYLIYGTSAALRDLQP